MDIAPLNVAKDTKADPGEWRLARIDSTWFGIEDHGCLTFDLGFDYGGSHQGIGHLTMATHADVGERPVKLIYRILEVFGGYGDLTHLKGTALWVKHDSGRIYAMKQLEPDGGKEIVFGEILSRD